MNEKPIIQCDHLKKYFDTPSGKLHAVDDISFNIPQGHTLGVVGESGCGKSTLGRTVLRLIPKTDGTVLFNGEDIYKKNHFQMKAMRREMQIIFQDPLSSLNPKMTVAKSIEEPLLIHGIYRNKKERREKVLELMNLAGVDLRYADAYPHELDGGRQQRVGIAKALALNPKFIVCDEPVSALDVSIQAQVLNLMMDLKDDLKLTYMFISHDLAVVKHISDQIMVLYLGKNVEMASPDQLFSNPVHPYTKALLNAIPIPNLSAINREPEILEGEVTSPINPPVGCRFASRCPLADEQCRKCYPETIEVEPGHTVACHKAQQFG